MRNKIVKVPLAGTADTAGALGRWQNTEGRTIIIDRLEVQVTTIATGACTMDAGPTATSATTLSDTLIDGIDVHVAGIYDNLNDAGTNGKSRQTLAHGKWVTFSTASGAAAGLVGNAYIHFHGV